MQHLKVNLISYGLTVVSCRSLTLMSRAGFLVEEPAQLLVLHLWNSPGSSGLAWRRWPQVLAHALGVTNSEDRRGMSEQKDGQTHAVTDARTVERELAWCYREVSSLKLLLV